MVNEQLKSEVYDFALSISRMRTRISTREVNPVTDDEVRVHDYDTETNHMSRKWKYTRHEVVSC